MKRRWPTPTIRYADRRSRLSTLFELRGKSWIVLLCFSVTLGLLGYCCTRLLVR